jgi:Icc-related predicted phosphoesterase
MSEHVKTSFLIMADSHGHQLLSGPLTEHIDVAIHCGDLTDESKIEEFQKTLQYLQELEADLKLVIAGNHDFTTDVPAFEKLVANAKQPLEPELVRKTYGDYGEIRKLLSANAEAANIIFLDEGSYEFRLRNGAILRVYASPFTPSLSGDWGFQYHPNEGHNFEIPETVDIVITHSPPKGILDYTDGRRAGCPSLFQAVARARPRLHCFGHIHEGWGGKLVSWRRNIPSNSVPSHFTHIDNSKSIVLSNISQLETARRTSDLTYFSADCDITASDSQTLFVNAALQGTSGFTQIPWIVNIPLPRV